MYHNLLIPLDRTSFAEQALPLALSIARRAKARLDLVEVHDMYALEDPSAGWLPYMPDRDNELKQHEHLYLDATAKWAASGSAVSTSTALLSGSTVLASTVADSILERARSSNASLIVMTTHGRGSLARFGLGSVADELVRRAEIPVLLKRPTEHSTKHGPEPLLDNMLIPLDGSPLGEEVLRPALELARLMEARCCFLRVLDNDSSSVKCNAKTYLDRLAANAIECGVKVQTQVIVGRHVAEAILKEARLQAINLIALATHGRGGLERALLGSVADKLIRNSTSPVLVCRPEIVAL